MPLVYSFMGAHSSCLLFVDHPPRNSSPVGLPHRKQRSEKGGEKRGKGCCARSRRNGRTSHDFHSLSSPSSRERRTFRSGGTRPPGAVRHLIRSDGSPITLPICVNWYNLWINTDEPHARAPSRMRAVVQRKESLQMPPSKYPMRKYGPSRSCF